MARPVWSGAISLGLVYIPVNLIPAEKPDELDLSMLDKRDFAPIGFKRYNKNTGKDVTWDDIVKGYEYEPERYVVLGEEDFREANVKATQTIDLLSFVDVGEVSPVYFEKPYFLVPGRRGEKVYALLREALAKSGKAAVAQVVIRVRQHLALITAQDDALMLNTLRYANELRDVKEANLDNTSVKATRISGKEIDMALALIEQMSEPWDPAQYRDSYRDDLMAHIERKIKSRQTHVIAKPHDEGDGEKRGSAEIIDLMDLLRKSLPGKDGKGGTAKSAASATKRSTAREPAPVERARTSKTKASGTAKAATRPTTRSAAKPKTATKRTTTRTATRSSAKSSTAASRRKAA